MKIGLLPLYIALYDRTSPSMRPRLEAFYQEIAQEFAKRGVEVETSPFCRLKPEFEQAVGKFEAAGVDALVTLHMAYSPSLESIDVLAGTALPIVVLDTTETLEFTNGQDPVEIDYNHGIHGVMDMCSMLTREGKDYAVAAGHYRDSDVLDRVCGYVRAAKAAGALRGARVGLVGGAFDGMGDFRVPYEELKERFGVEVVEQKAERMRGWNAAVSEAEVDAEMSANAEAFDFAGGVDPDEYRAAVRSCLTLRRCLEEDRLSSFSVNFTCIGGDSGLESMPFLECCKAMGRGIGYAGEGDALTAAFVGALMRGYPDTTFVEIFCPDWKNGTLFLSHMGEINYRIADTKPCVCRAGVNYTPGGFPYVGYARMKGGVGVYVNVCRGRDDYKLVAAPAEMLSVDEDTFGRTMRGWMRPRCTTARFLEELSRNGATHHSAFVYGATADEIVYFGRRLGLETAVIGGK